MPESYKCPHCGTLTMFVLKLVVSSYPERRETAPLNNFYESQSDGLEYRGNNGLFHFFHPKRVFVTECCSCGNLVFWENGEIQYPVRNGIIPAEDMPQDAKEVFNEAQAIIALSPRAACALLRVCLERIVDWYGENEHVEGFKKSDKLYKKIETIGISPAFQRICKACRIAGNEHAHSGEIDLSGEDSFEIAEAMSRMINSLVNTWIAPIRESEEVLRKLGKE